MLHVGNWGEGEEKKEGRKALRTVLKGGSVATFPCLNSYSKQYESRWNESPNPCSRNLLHRYYRAIGRNNLLHLLRRHCRSPHCAKKLGIDYLVQNDSSVRRNVAKSWEEVVEIHHELVDVVQRLGFATNIRTRCRNRLGGKIVVVVDCMTGRTVLDAVAAGGTAVSSSLRR